MIADIFQIVNCEITLAYSAVPYLVGLVGPFDRRSILYMHASAAAGNRDPKVIQHVTMEAKAVARGKPDDLHWVWLLQRTGTRLGLFRGRTRTCVFKLSLIRLSEPRLEVFIGASVG